VTAAVLIAVLLGSLPLMEGGASATGLFVTHTLVFALLGAAVGIGRRRGRIALATGWEGVAGLALVVWIAVSWLGVDYRFGSFLSMWDAVTAALLASALLLLADAGRMDTRPAGVVVAVGSAAQALHAFFVAPQANLTPSGTFANANQLAAYLDIGIFVSAAMALELLRGPDGAGARGRKWAAAGLGLVAVIDTAALMRIGSRGGIIALLAGAVIWVLASVPPGRSRRVAWSALALLVILSAAAVAWRFERIGDPYRFDRVRIWGASIEAARDHPLLGMGPGMFERRGYRYNFPLDREMFRYAKNLGSTHSAWLQAAAEWGAPGLLLSLVLAVLVATKLWRLSGARAGRAAAGPALALLSCLIIGVVDTPFGVPAITLTLIVLIAPLVAPRDAGGADLRIVLMADPDPRGRPPARRLMLASSGFLLAVAWLGAVALPYAAHVCFVGGMTPRALRLNPVNPLYWTVRAEQQWRRDRPLTPGTLARVDHDLGQASRLDPGDPLPLLDRARLHARAWFDIGAEPAAASRARRYYREAIALGGRDPRPLLELGTFLMAAGGPDEAMERIDEAVRLEPNFLAARMARARALLERGDPASARDELERLEQARRRLAGYVPRNGYESDLMRLDEAALARLRTRLGPT